MLALAARHAIAVTVAPALLALDDVHLRLGLAYTSTGTLPPTERPSDRWFLFMRHTFLFDHHGRYPGTSTSCPNVRPAWSGAPRGVRHRLRKAPESERKIIARLMLDAATWLLHEEYVLCEGIELAGSVYYRSPRPYALVPTTAIDALWCATRPAKSSLLNHSEPNSIDCILRARYDDVRGYCDSSGPDTVHRLRTY